MKQALELALEAIEYVHDTGDTQTFDMCYAKPALAALKEALAQPEQEPVAWRFQSAVGGWAYGKEPPIGSKYAVEPLYTTPPQRKPLTDEEISEYAERMEASDPTDSFWREFARAIEAAHGIKE